jgi:hypothetical protein
LSIPINNCDDEKTRQTEMQRMKRHYVVIMYLFYTFLQKITLTFNFSFIITIPIYHISAPPLNSFRYLFAVNEREKVFNIEIKNYGYNMYIQRRMKTEGVKEITVQII